MPARSIDQSRGIPFYTDPRVPYPSILESFMRKESIPTKIVHYAARAYSLEEVSVIVKCLRTIMPEHRISVIETHYLTDYRIEVYDRVVEDTRHG